MLTLGEYRQRRGEAPPENEILANAPLNPALLSVYMQSLQGQGQEQEAGPRPGQEGTQQEPRQELGPGDYEDEGGNRWRAHDERPEPPEDDLLGKAWYPLEGLNDLGEDDGL